MRVAVIIAAGGTSSRFGEGRDKLSQDLGGRAMLIRTVEAFAKRETVTAIIVAGPAHDYENFRERYAATLGFHGASVVRGGEVDRWESVRNALDAVPDDCTHVAVHDAARPAVNDALLNRVFEAAAHRDAVIPAVAVRGTIKRVSGESQILNPASEEDVADLILGGEGRIEISGREIVETLDRRNLVEVQTPQVFRASLLKRAYFESDPSGTTDDASAVERLGEVVYVVEGDPRNIKVTTPEDLDLIRAILNVKPPAERPVHKRF